MNNLQLFKNEQFGTIRTVVKDGDPWFVAADVCKALDIANPSDALNRLDDDERTLVSIEGASNGLPVNVVNEPGLYTLILGSRKPEAHAFKRWITHDVLPAIRRTGMYVQPGAVTNAMAELHAAMDAMADMLGELKQRVPRHSALDRALAAQAEGRLEPRHVAAGNGAAHALLDREKIGRKITVYMVEEDLTVDEFADLAGVDKRSVFRWKNGTHAPAGNALTRVCELLGCDITDLLR